MIVVDASALVAILLNEPEAASFREKVLTADTATLSPVGYWEAATRLRSTRGEGGVEDLNDLMRELRVSVWPATDVTARLASEAERAFGKRSPARLNLGDCFAYALAKEHAARLLYKGEDFALTDILPAV